ncbi:MAG: prepilin-type N-terminal cleavage/methylation domain-containing protein [Candidatus Gracilibacteria bacterium]|nr:prepilin-type N-terminal cleavage/methylation domain-containing protein [Candidatus Gracilibacteria bacterium]
MKINNQVNLRPVSTETGLARTKAFTLVELIVVITILAILGTIAFINLQGYSISARDGKRVSDINNIMKKIGIESSKGTSLSTLINTTKTNSGLIIDGNSGSSIQGTANFATLKEDGSKFKDPVTKGDYVFSYSVGGNGTGAYKFNQVSTVNEETNTAVVKGNYYQMQTGDSPSITITDDDYYVVSGGVDLPYIIDNNLALQEIDIVDFETEDGYTVIEGTFTRTNVEKNEGSYSIESGNQTDSSQSCFEVTRTKSSDFDISFDYKVSSESGWDYLSFYANGILDNQWSGEEGWSTYTNTYSTGNYTFKWCYEKDGSDFAGQDKAWVDIIKFIDNSGGVANLDDAICGKDENKHLYITPTRLCEVGTPTVVEDAGILGDYSWECLGNNGGINVKCKGRHAFAWDYNPVDIRDIFGNRSIYTENWENNTCDPSSMSIVDLDPGTNVIPTTLADNTIYRLAAGDYIQTDPFQFDPWQSPTSVYFGTCSGLIGIGSVNLYTSIDMSYSVTLGNSNNIFSGISLYGTNNGSGGTHLSNDSGLSIGASNITIYNANISEYGYSGIGEYGNGTVLNKLNIYNNSHRGIDKVSDNAIYSNINIYNNSSIGFWTDSGYNNIYSNIVSYNNNGAGIRFGWENGSSMSNIITYNNNGSGIYGFNGAFTINNLYSYNNNSDGLKFYDWIEDANFNNINTYNNIGVGSIITGDNPGSALLFGTLKSFGNIGGDFQVTNTDYGVNSTLGFSDGINLDTSGVFGSSWLIEPVTAGWDINLKGRQNLPMLGGVSSYTYGSNIGNQKQPIFYDTNTYTPELWGVDGVHYDSSKKVGQW